MFTQALSDLTGCNERFVNECVNEDVVIALTKCHAHLQLAMCDMSDAIHRQSRHESQENVGCESEGDDD